MARVDPTGGSEKLKDHSTGCPPNEKEIWPERGKENRDFRATEVKGKESLEEGSVDNSI